MSNETYPKTLARTGILHLEEAICVSLYVIYDQNPNNHYGAPTICRYLGFPDSYAYRDIVGTILENLRTKERVDYDGGGGWKLTVEETGWFIIKNVYIPLN